METPKDRANINSGNVAHADVDHGAFCAEPARHHHWLRIPRLAGVLPTDSDVELEGVRDSDPEIGLAGVADLAWPTRGGSLESGHNSKMVPARTIGLSMGWLRT